MRLRKILIMMAVMAVALPGTAHAESGFKVTGGGQSFVGDAGQGPGDTFGFNAQDIDGDAGDEAKGRLNHIDRSDNDGDGRNEGKGIHYRGDVTCLKALSTAAEQGAARFGGVIQNGNTDSPLYFSVDVTDNGEGDEQDDLIFFRTFTDEEREDQGICDYEPDAEPDDYQLARGNVQVHNYEAPEEEESSTSSLNLLGL